MTEKWDEAAKWAENLDELGPDSTVTRGDAASHAEIQNLLEDALGGSETLQRAVRGRPAAGRCECGLSHRESSVSAANSRICNRN